MVADAGGGGHSHFGDVSPLGALRSLATGVSYPGEGVEHRVRRGIRHLARVAEEAYHR